MTAFTPASHIPLLDGSNLLRVGGRLHNALLSYEEKHLVILAKHNHLALLLMHDAHERALHADPQLTRSLLLRRYWIIHANSLVRAVIHRCIRCTRFRTDVAQQQKGDFLRTGYGQAAHSPRQASTMPDPCRSAPPRDEVTGPSKDISVCSCACPPKPSI